jgi:hypothetical protein
MRLFLLFVLYTGVCAQLPKNIQTFLDDFERGLEDGTRQCTCTAEAPCQNIVRTMKNDIIPTKIKCSTDCGSVQNFLCCKDCDVTTPTGTSKTYFEELTTATQTPSQTTQTAPQTTQPAPQTTETASQTTQPAPQTSEKLPQTTEPILNGITFAQLKTLSSTTAADAITAPSFVGTTDNVTGLGVRVGDRAPPMDSYANLTVIVGVAAGAVVFILMVLFVSFRVRRRSFTPEVTINPNYGTTGTSSIYYQNALAYPPRDSFYESAYSVPDEHPPQLSATYDNIEDDTTPQLSATYDNIEDEPVYETADTVLPVETGYGRPEGHALYDVADC